MLVTQFSKYMVRRKIYNVTRKGRLGGQKLTAPTLTLFRICRLGLQSGLAGWQAGKASLARKFTANHRPSGWSKDLLVAAHQDCLGSFQDSCEFPKWFLNSVFETVLSFVRNYWSKEGKTWVERVGEKEQRFVTQLRHLEMPKTCILMF